MSLWLSVALATTAVLAAAYELAANRERRPRKSHASSPRRNAIALITFLVLIIIGQFLVSLWN